MDFFDLIFGFGGLGGFFGGDPLAGLILQVVIAVLALVFFFV